MLSHRWIPVVLAACVACDRAEVLGSEFDVPDATIGSDTEPVFENCFNGADDNGDQLIDCADPDCRSLSACREFSCPDGILGDVIGYPAFEASTEGASNNLAGSCGGQGGEELALLWTAPADGDYWIDTRGHSYDTVLYILDGCDGEELLCNDDALSPPSLRSEVLLTAEASEDYLIVVDGYDVVNGPDGDEFQLNITPVDLPSEVGFCSDQRDNDEDGVQDCDDDDCLEFEACLPLEGVVEIEAGNNHTCATTDQTTYCWGAGGVGQLGVGATTATARPLPLDARWHQVSAGSEFTCGVSSSAELYCWGTSNWGRLLRPQEDGHANAPHAVGIADVVDVSVGWNHVCAAMSEGDVLCWGYNGSGQVGNGDTGGAMEDATEVPVSDARSVDVGAQTSCAIDHANLLWCWGSNGNGQIDEERQWSVLVPLPIAADVLSAANGDNHLCALFESGQVQCRGANWSGQLGTDRVNERREFGPVAVPNPAVSVDCGSAHCCALDEGGTIWCWGANGWGQLGTGDNETRFSPVAVDVETEFVSVTTGQNTTCARSSAGEAWCWGANSSGQLGDATRANSWTPRRVLRALED